MRYKYDDILRPHEEIRVAMLEPGTFEDPIVVRFVRRRLKDETPAYEALSYVWGSEDNPSIATIRDTHVRRPAGLQRQARSSVSQALGRAISSIRSSPFVTKASTYQTGSVPITRNLDLALRHLRHEKKPRSIWIDALCINQANDQEKSLQVSNMGTIFAAADSVIAWLGPGENGSSGALALLHELAQNIEIDWPTDAVRLHRNPAPEGASIFARWNDERQKTLSIEIDGHRQLFWSIEQCRSVLGIVTRPYFERAWILQEVRLATRVVIHCGFATLPEERFWKAVVCLRAASRTDDSFMYASAWRWSLQKSYLIAHFRSEQHFVPLLSLRRRTDDLICRDPRDSIYCVLSILDPTSRSLQIRPDYAQKTEEVYKDVVRRMFSIWLCLDSLDQCELSNRTLPIPSWVPDWSTPLACKNPLPLEGSACAKLAVQPRFDETGSRCTIHGISIGSIGRTSALATSPEYQRAADIVKLLRQLRPSEWTPDDLYLTGETLLEVYCRILVGNYFLKAGSRQSISATPSFEQSLRLLQLVWSNNTNEEYLQNAVSESTRYLESTKAITSKRGLFETPEGYLGLAPLETLPGDMLCILLGCSYPVILRPAAENTWLVVGRCYAHGLTEGEAIYHSLSALKARSESSIGDTCSMFDPQDKSPRYRPDVMFRKAGLKIERVQEDPYRLVVLPETLTAAGVPLQEFVLV